MERDQAPGQPAAPRARLPGRLPGIGGLTFTYEDDRFAYPEQRYVTLGFLGVTVVSIVHTESPSLIRIISFRRATTHEEALLRDVLPD